MNPDVIIIIRPDKRETKGQVNLSAKKNFDVKVGDLIYSHQNTKDERFYWEVLEILERRQSSMKERDYITTISKIVKKVKL